MKTILTTTMLTLALLTSCSEKQTTLEVVSFNVRLDHEGDGINQWKNRVPLVTDYLMEIQPDIIGMQEVLPNQLADLKEILAGYESVSAGRMDGKSEGEACPVFYNKEVFELLDKGHFWLSETPDVPGSMNWDTHFPRIVTWVNLKQKTSGKEFFFFNTHYSHVSEEARERSSELLVKQITKIAGSHPVILTGDFNTPAGSAPYNRLIAGAGNQVRLIDAESLAETVINGDVTYNAFDPGFEGKRIDFIFVNDSFDVKMHAVNEVRKDSLFISDHFPVRGEVILKGE
jgi:endonuclease/exonuclease/phosphatase family metal-dependent hydrolase